MVSFLVGQKDKLFQSREQTYRIPALIYLAQHHTLLAFAEQRAGKADEKAKKIVLRRGQYQAETHQVQWQEMEVMETAQLEGHRSMSPCPVYDEDTGTLFLLFITVPNEISESHQLQNKTNLVRVCYVTSRDLGSTWSPATDFTSSAIGPIYTQWATFCIGPGHGVQLHNRSRSLVVPAYAYRLLESQKQPTPHTFCLRSDDHGETWKMGHFVSMGNTSESQVAEVSAHGEKVLYCNSRSSLGRRVQAVSPNDGDDFQDARQIEKLIEPPHGCHGSVIGFPNPTPNVPGSADTWVLYSHPTDPLRRRDLGLYINRDPLDPAGWSKPVILSNGFCAYSDLQYMGLSPNGSPQFGCLFEHGDYEEIFFVALTLQDPFF
ncbi:sialidase-2 [Antechinus flavipes]|uniref:sialidase-2 n=1 Tax=Antechinus flavipes TaxID=38775 RepID=UPI0022360847|nr:sialidase-2 [Antechinus flavipes]XP_051855279.1 sialidase-2 [Antechinus flavipes]